MPDILVIGMGGLGGVWAIDLLDLESLLGEGAGRLKGRRVGGRGIVVWFRAGCERWSLSPRRKRCARGSNCRGQRCWIPTAALHDGRWDWTTALGGGRIAGETGADGTYVGTAMS